MQLGHTIHLFHRPEEVFRIFEANKAISARFPSPGETGQNAPIHSSRQSKTFTTTNR
jgi:hypothetical protein